MTYDLAHWAIVTNTVTNTENPAIWSVDKIVLTCLYIQFVQNGTVLEHWKHLSPGELELLEFLDSFSTTTNRI